MVLDAIAQGIAKTGIKSIHKTNKSIIQRAERMSNKTLISDLYGNAVLLALALISYLLKYHSLFAASSTNEEIVDANKRLYDMYAMLNEHFHPDFFSDSIEMPKVNNLDEDT